MKNRSWHFDFWHWFGILAAFGLAVWGSLYLYHYLDRYQGPNIEVTGSYNAIKLPPYSPKLNEKDRALYKEKITGMLPENGVLNIDPSPILDYTWNTFRLKEYTNLKSNQGVWHFEIINFSDKSIPAAKFEIPVSGKYLLIGDSEPSTEGDFNQQISFGTLLPHAVTNLYIWMQEPLNAEPEYYLSRSFFTYNGGKVLTDYELKTEGLLAWNLKNNNYPLFIFLGSLLVLFALCMVLFYNIGLNTGLSKQETVIEFGSRK